MTVARSTHRFVRVASLGFAVFAVAGCAITPAQQMAKQIDEFKGRPTPKSMAVGYYKDGTWVSGSAWSQPSIEKATLTAIRMCEEQSAKRGSPISCQTIYQNNNYVSPQAGQGDSKQVQITSPQPPKIGTGSGVFISADGMVLTAEHVIRDAKQIEVIAKDGSRFQAKVHASSRSLDLAILTTNTTATTYLPVRLTGPTPGAKVFTVGYPVPGVLGQTPKVSDGIINAASGIRDDAGFMQISIPIQPGNSGGPVITEDGTLVGVVTSSAALAPFLERTGTVPQNVNWAVHSSLAVTLLGKEGGKPQPRTRDESIAQALRASVLVLSVGK